MTTLRFSLVRPYLLLLLGLLPLTAFPQDGAAGLTLWRLRPANATDRSNTIIERDGDSFVAEAMKEGDIFAARQKLRLTIEPTQRAYLYVVTREMRSDGTFGRPALLFPQTETDDNLLIPGQPFALPRNPNDFYSFAPNNAQLQAEFLTLILSETKLSLRDELAARLAEWEKDAPPAPALRVELTAGPNSYLSDFIAGSAPDQAGLRVPMGRPPVMRPRPTPSLGQVTAAAVVPVNTAAQSFYLAPVTAGRPLLLNVKLPYSQPLDTTTQEQKLRARIPGYERLRAFWRTNANAPREAQALLVAAANYLRLDAKPKAQQHFAEAVKVLQKARLQELQAVAQVTIGSLYLDAGLAQDALDAYEQALQIWRALRNRQGESATLYNLSLIYYTLNDKASALSYLQQALPYRLEIAKQAQAGRAVTRSNAAQAIDRQRPVDALTNSETKVSRATLSKTKVPPRPAPRRDKPDENLIVAVTPAMNTLMSLGWVQMDLGQTDAARKSFAQALALSQQVKSWNSGKAVALNNFARFYAETGDTDKALEYYRQAYQLWLDDDDPARAAQALLNTAALHLEAKRYAEALDSYREAYNLALELEDRTMLAKVTGNQGAVYEAQGKSDEARRRFNDSLRLRRELRDRYGEARMLHRLARVEREAGRLDAALSNIEKALTIVEGLRANVVSQELRASYFATVQEYYELHVDILAQMQRAADALQANERGRARSLLEMLHEAGADIRQGADPNLLARERSLQRELNAKAKEQLDLWAQGNNAPGVAAEIERLTAELRQVEAALRQASPGYAALTQPQPLSAQEIQAQLHDDKTLLLEYRLGTERSYLWAVTRKELKLYELPARDVIEAQARRVYQLMRLREEPFADTPQGREERKQRVAQADSELPAAAAQLSRTVLGPLAFFKDQMPDARYQRILLVSDGALQYIPFGMLPLPSGVSNLPSDISGVQIPEAKNQYLLAQHEIVVLPSASTLAVLRGKKREPATNLVAVIADPVFDAQDERVRPSARAGGPAQTSAARQMGLVAQAMPQQNSQRATIARLPGTRAEAEAITGLAKSGKSKMAMGFAANREFVTGGALEQYRVVHFATHGFVNSERPELSGLVLSLVDEKGRPRDGFLRAHEIFNLKLGADLVVLSACQTGLGKEVRGEGLLGLTRGFMYAGAPRVVVSLWSVSDNATKELMTRFYSNLWEKGLTPAAALRAAQLELLNAEPRWAAPYYWAAFTLQGEPE